ncbi:hypothetical protein [Bradyrhizobium sp.]|uniref:hypothetical protein n=1 Tax=Bradyrhizobium sp. TaxID=376 RepID=UPI0025C57D8E|nr:hypothetical protein [Bradyrhizobium sp.]
MPDELVPDVVLDLIQRHIDSVAQLEALLLLRANPADSWTASLIARRLYAPEDDIVRALALLCADGFLTRDHDTYRYECSVEKRERVNRLAEVYSRHLILVTNLIHAKPRNIRQFSDAFKFRMDD